MAALIVLDRETFSEGPRNFIAGPASAADSVPIKRSAASAVNAG